MSIPDYESLMLPLLQLLANRQPWSTRQAIEVLAKQFSLTPVELAQMLPSGAATTFGSRVGWAKTYLKQAGLIEQPKRGISQITERGMAALSATPQRIDNEFLERYSEFQNFRTRTRNGGASNASTDKAERKEVISNGHLQPPQERMETAAREVQQSLSDEILQTIKDCSPGFFERLVVQLLLKMGYGGSRQEAGQAVGRSGDGDIDGVIAEDRLGLDSIYVQAKRWQGSVGEPPLRDFLGALVSRGASKGVFITTGLFTDAAQQFARRSPQHKVVLIDGPRLAELMIEHDLGVSVAATYQLKRIDSDFFSED
jgi:restriction system protein